LSRDLQTRVRRRLTEEWSSHPPYAPAAFYSLKEGAGREPFWVPSDFRARLGSDKQPHPFGGLYAAWLYGQRCGERDAVNGAFPQIKESFESFERSKWKLDGDKGDLFANRYLAAFLAYGRLAKAARDDESATR